MRHTLALTALLVAAPLLHAQAPPARTRPKSPTFKTGESPEAPMTPLARKLKSDFEAANAAARAALSRLKAQPVPRPPTQEQKLALAAHQAGVDKPCDRTLFNLEGAAANFTIQPGQLILLNGCFKGSSNAEVRIEGGSFPNGALLLEVQDRGDGYFYGKVPDIAGVPDQPVSVCVRFFSDGFKTSPRSGSFYAKRQTWDVLVDDRVCHGLRVDGAMPFGGSGPVVPCEAPSGPAVHSWSSKARASGYGLTKFWWISVVTDSLGHSNYVSPTSVRPSDDGSTVLVTAPKNCTYGAYRVRIEGPAGPPPF